MKYSDGGILINIPNILLGKYEYDIITNVLNGENELWKTFSNGNIKSGDGIVFFPDDRRRL